MTNQAVQDLKDIWNYTFDHWSEKQADKYFKEILEHCSKVANDTTASVQYENLIPKLKGSKVNKHIVFYRQLNPNENERILHERMDLKSRLLENKNPK